MVSVLVIEVDVETTLILTNRFLYFLIRNCSWIADFDFFVVCLTQMLYTVFTTLSKLDNKKKLLKSLLVEISSLYCTLLKVLQRVNSMLLVKLVGKMIVVKTLIIHSLRVYFYYELFLLLLLCFVLLLFNYFWLIGFKYIDEYFSRFSGIFLWIIFD
jgi:hypothetical protein